MNERIRELAVNAGYGTRWTSTEQFEQFMDQFALLIVRECADVCDRFQARDVGMQPAECAGAIRKMFGVE